MLPINPVEASRLGAAAPIPNSTAPAAAGANTPPPKAEILFGEYLYAMNTALQANEDRGKAVNFMILITSIFAAAMSQLVGQHAPAVAFIGLLGGLGLIGWMHFFMIVRLRQAFHESIMCMTQIKQYWFGQYPADLNFKNAFLWKSATIPSPGRAWTISFFSAFTVAMIDAAALGAAAAFAVREALSPGSLGLAFDSTKVASLTPNFMFAVGVACALAILLIQLAVYFIMLRGGARISTDDNQA